MMKDSSPMLLLFDAVKMILLLLIKRWRLFFDLGPAVVAKQGCGSEWVVAVWLPVRRRVTNSHLQIQTR